jgi:hypothetical protein
MKKRASTLRAPEIVASKTGSASPAARRSCSSEREARSGCAAWAEASCNIVNLTFRRSLAASAASINEGNRTVRSPSSSTMATLLTISASSRLSSCAIMAAIDAPENAPNHS